MNKDKEKYSDYYEILELEESASLADINRSFRKLKELYSSESMVLDPIEDEFSLEERQEIVDRLEEAYKALILYVVEKDRVQKDATRKAERMEDTAEEEQIEEDVEQSEAEAPLPGEEIEKIPDPDQDQEDAVLLLEERADWVNGKKPGNDATVYVHESRHEYEHVHIDLPEKVTTEGENSLENAFKTINAELEKNGDKEKEERKVNRKGIWDESLFTKNIKEIKKELTQDLHEAVTITDGAPEPPEPQPPVKEELDSSPIHGHTLRNKREKLGMGIHEIAVSTKIHYKILVNIEKERFAKLPDPGYLRWYLITYAKALSLDTKRVADEYMKLYRQWERLQKGYI
jgi:curved DNA-binding protein CbpA